MAKFFIEYYGGLRGVEVEIDPATVEDWGSPVATARAILAKAHGYSPRDIAARTDEVTICGDEGVWEGKVGNNPFRFINTAIQSRVEKSHSVTSGPVVGRAEMVYGQAVEALQVQAGLNVDVVEFARAALAQRHAQWAAVQQQAFVEVAQYGVVGLVQYPVGQLGRRRRA